MGNLIQLLPESIANQIAAGEVVQRPASVVKELLENAVDAGANHIILRVEQAGKASIQVEDNGRGMEPGDARMCFERHATSKLRTADDLFNIQTKGFRGEAMASIASVAQVELSSRTENQELGTKVLMEASHCKTQEPIAAAKGTTVTVKNLFYNIPARRNFLKSDAVEIRHIIDEFQRVAIPHTQIHFQLIHNNSELFHLPPAKLRQRLIAIFGNRLNEKLVPIQEETNLVKISGFIGKPTAARKTRGEQFFFVNNRFIRDYALNHAVKTAFAGLIPSDHFPTYFIFLECQPSFIDVNIHPTKTEVKFEDERVINAFLRSSIRKALGQFQVAPSLDFQQEPELDPNSWGKSSGRVEAPSIRVNPDFNPFHEEKSKLKSPSQPFKGHRPKHVHTSEWEAVFENIPDVQSEAEGSPNLGFQEEKNTGPVIFQWNRSHLVTSVKSGVVLIDQHRAHQRIWYERLIETKSLSAQRLLFPQDIEMSSAELAGMKEVQGDLAEMGLHFDLFPNKISIQTLPGGMQESEVKPLIESLMEDLKQGQNASMGLEKSRLSKILARSLAIPRGRSLSKEEMQEMMDSLFACSEPSISPFGKPVLITLEGEEILKRFNA